MAGQHTPGPWRTKREGFSTVYVEARIGGGLIQEVAACGPTEAGQEQQAANARLIAAAPELLGLLQKFVDRGLSMTRIEEARALIAKATGEQK